MHLGFHIFYFAIGLASFGLDYFLINAFRHEHYRIYYRYIAEYTELAELVIYITFLCIAIFISGQTIKEDKDVKDWQFVVDAFMVLATLESLARVFAMTILSIHIHPGKLDFMGLFLFMVLLYCVMKYGAIMAVGSGLRDLIHNSKPKPKSLYGAITISNPTMWHP